MKVKCDERLAFELSIAFETAPRMENHSKVRIDVRRNAPVEGRYFEPPLLDVNGTWIEDRGSIEIVAASLDADLVGLVLGCEGLLREIAGEAPAHASRLDSQVWVTRGSAKPR
jgi:hypothetical protein